jgi:hypothetical protein
LFNCSFGFKLMNMKEVSINKDVKLSPHFTIGELTKTSYYTLDGNIPSRVAIENLKNLCENWLEDLRYSYNMLYGDGVSPPELGGVRGGLNKGLFEGDQTTPAPIPEQSSPTRSLSYSGGEMPIVISSGYRSEEVNRKCGGAKGSNHLTGCAVDIRCLGPEQMIRYACLLLDTADENGWVFDELIQEKRGTTYWIHFAVRPSGNRRKILFDCR